MTDLTIMVPCYKPLDAPCNECKMSAKRVGAVLWEYGMDRRFVDLVNSKIEDLRKELRFVETKYVLVMDSRDTIFIHSPERILEDFLAQKCNILVGASLGCWPPNIAYDYWIKRASGKGARQFPNTGTIIGGKTALVKALGAMLKFVPRDIANKTYPAKWAREDQAWWSWSAMKGYVRYEIDREYKLFYATNRRRPRLKEFRILNGECVLPDSPARPHILHFFGQAHHKGKNMCQRFRRLERQWLAE